MRRRTDRAGLHSLSVIAAFLTLAGCGANGNENKKPPPPEAGFVIVKAATVPLINELAGRTSAYEMSEVRPQVSGVVQARLFTEGSVVHAGQTLYRIDPSLYRAAVAQAQANLASARANHAAAEARANRYKPLVAMEAVSQQEYTDARAAANQSRAAVAQNEAALQTASINLRFTGVPAPITGRIGRSMVTTGALVTSGQAEPLTTIQRLDPMFVDIQQSSTELLELRRILSMGGAVPARAQVRLRLEDGRDYGYTGTLQFTESVVDPSTGTVTLRAQFPNPEGLLLPGMFVRARIAQEVVENAILVPQQAVSRDPNGDATVILVGAGNTAVRRVIKADRTVGDQWLVTAGLKPGERVITEGLGKVNVGKPVRPVPAGAPSQRSSGGKATG